MLVIQVSFLQVERNISLGEAAFSYGQGNEANVLSPRRWRKSLRMMTWKMEHEELQSLGNEEVGRWQQEG